MTDRRGAGAGTPAANPDLVALHRHLIDVVDQLERAIGRATTAAEVTAILDEIAEVNARVTSVGRQLFTQQTAQITSRVAAVTEAIAEVNRTIQDLESVKKLVQGVTRFLAIVDKAIDVAKTVI